MLRDSLSWVWCTNLENINSGFSVNLCSDGNVNSYCSLSQLGDSSNICQYKHYLVFLIGLYFRILVFLYFSDARHMAREVHDVVRGIIIEKGKMSAEAADKYLKKMDSQKRYSADVWS